MTCLTKEEDQSWICFTTTTLRHEQTDARLAHFLDGSSYIISSKSTTAHDMCSRTTTPFPFLFATHLPNLLSPLPAQEPSRSTSQPPLRFPTIRLLQPSIFAIGGVAVPSICCLQDGYREHWSTFSSGYYRFLHLHLPSRRMRRRDGLGSVG